MLFLLIINIFLTMKLFYFIVGFILKFVLEILQQHIILEMQFAC